MQKFIIISNIELLVLPLVYFMNVEKANKNDSDTVAVYHGFAITVKRLM